MKVYPDYILKNNNLLILICILFFALPFERVPTFEVSGFTVKISYIVGLLLIAVSLFRARTLLKNKFDLGDLALLGFLVVGMAGLFKSDDLKRGIATIFMWLFVFVIYFILAKLFKNEEYRIQAEKFLLIATFIVCLFGLYQFVLDSLNFSTAYSLLRLRYTKAVLGFPRIQSVALEPLYFANFLLVPLFLSVKKFFFERNALNRYFGLITLILVNIILTVSRGAYLSLSFSMIIFLIYFLFINKSYRGRVIWVVGNCLVSVVIALLLVAILNGGSKVTSFWNHTSVNDSTNASSVQGRQQGYLSAIDKFKQNPVFGIGISNSGILPEPVYENGEVLTYGSINNEYLEILSETGLVGLVFFLLFLFSLIWLFFKRIKQADKEHRTSLILLGLGLVAIFIQYNFFSTLYIIYIWAFLALLRGEMYEENKIG